MIKRIKNIIKWFIKLFTITYVLFPKRVECNVCGFSCRRFMSTYWHKYINCPNCLSDIRHRLFIAAIDHIDEVSIKKIINYKDILHFSPEKIISKILMNNAKSYTTTNLLEEEADLSLDITNMCDIKDESYDCIIAFDILEHVSDYKKALNEIYRCLRSEGFGILSVPQKDNLSKTYEDHNITLPKERLKIFGQEDHLRIFGSDFLTIITNVGFSSAIQIDNNDFNIELQRLHVLYPPFLSSHPLATNYRKVFFAKK